MAEQPTSRPYFLMCERNWVYDVLMAVAGFFGAYTYLLRGNVFCNAQTGNVVLMGLALGAGAWGQALYYLIPISAYILGALVSELLPNPVKRRLPLRWDLRATELSRAAAQLNWLLQTERSSGSPFDSGVSDGAGVVCLTAGDDAGEVVKVVRHLGYDLTEEDNARVYESFQRIAAKKHFVNTRELDAIVASSAMQVPSTYRIINYVITCGNMTSAMASLTLEKDGERQQGVCAGDGPIDAAFLAIEQIIGHHYELADYQIQTVTEGREAMGSALVKLRSNGKLYSGNGISTDVIGASIRAYISALNKIVYEGN